MSKISIRVEALLVTACKPRYQCRRCFARHEHHSGELLENAEEGCGRSKNNSAKVRGMDGIASRMVCVSGVIVYIS